VKQDLKQDILEKGAIVQRDRETYAVAPHIPGGIVSADTLRKIADVADRYKAQALKITSAQRIAIIGLPEEHLDAVWTDLGEPQGAPIGLCVRSVKICPGTDYCKRGQRDSVKVGLQMDAKYHGMQLPWKLKMGVSGCANDCAEVCVKDVGLIGTPRGWRVMIGGNGGALPRLSQKLLENIDSDEEALAIVERLISWFQERDRKGRFGKQLAEVSLDELRIAALGDQT
jgi:NAD(P)H-nitrite reductase large subunit